MPLSLPCHPGRRAGVQSHGEKPCRRLWSPALPSVGRGDNGEKGPRPVSRGAGIRGPEPPARPFRPARSTGSGQAPSTGSERVPDPGPPCERPEWRRGRGKNRMAPARRGRERRRERAPPARPGQARLRWVAWGEIQETDRPEKRRAALGPPFSTYWGYAPLWGCSTLLSRSRMRRQRCRPGNWRGSYRRTQADAMSSRP